MASAIQLKRQSYPFTQLAHQQTLCCRVLVVGGSVAAYAATLAALKAGEKVYLVQPHHLLGGHYDQRALSSWNHGRLLRQTASEHSLAGEDFAISQLQRQFRQTYHALEQQSVENQAMLHQQPELRAAALAAVLRSQLSPYLKAGRCRVIANAVPVMTLYATVKGQPFQVKQIIFKDRVRQCLFKILSQVTVDCSRGRSLLSLAPDLPLDPTARTLETLTPESFLPPSRWQVPARGHCYPNTIGIAEVGRWRPSNPKQISPAHQPPPWMQSLSQLWPQFSHPPLSQPAIRGLPITLPLGSFIPQALEGLILAGQQLGTTPGLETLGDFFPVAWATGESSGYLAAFALQSHTPLQQLSHNPDQWPLLQAKLLQQQIPLFWFDDVSTTDADFEAIQQLAIHNIFCSQNRRNLHFGPEKIVSRADFANALVNLLQPNWTVSQQSNFTDVPVQHWAHRSVETAVAQGWLSGISATEFLPESPLTYPQLHTLMDQWSLGKPVTVSSHSERSEAITHRDLAKWLYIFWQHLKSL